MAALDSEFAFKWSGGGSATWSGGGTGETITLTFEQGTIAWSETGRTYTEQRSRGRHESKPIAIETEDGNVTGSLTLLVTSFKGNANTYPYEAFTFTGNAASWSSTGSGSKKLGQLVVTMNSTPDGGGSQTITFAYVAIDSSDIDVAAADGLTQLSVSFTDLENRPTIA